MKVLIIGGTGVLSSAVVKEAINNGIEVTLINRGNRMNLIHKGVELIKSDKDDEKKIKSLLGSRYFDAVIDFLCYTDTQTERSFKLYSKYTKQYFFISSCAVYNNLKVEGFCNEDSPKSLPLWEYSVNKWKSEKLIMKLAEEACVNYTIIRPAVTYGNTRIPYGISPKYGYHWTLISRIMNGKPIIRWNGGINKVNMMRVEDFAVGVIGLIGNKEAYNEAFNICGDETPSFNDVLDVLAGITKIQPKTVDIDSDFYAKELPQRAGEILGGRSIDSLNSNEKIKKVVPNFKQTIDLKDGILLTYNYYLNNNYQLGIDWDFDGDTDRIIKKWCKRNHIDTKNMNLKFINYLNNAQFKDRLSYYAHANSNRLDVKLFILSFKIIRKILRIISKKRI